MRAPQPASAGRCLALPWRCRLVAVSLQRPALWEDQQRQVVAELFLLRGEPSSAVAAETSSSSPGLKVRRPRESSAQAESRSHAVVKGLRNPAGTYGALGPYRP